MRQQDKKHVHEPAQRQGAAVGADVLRAMVRDPRCVFLYWKLHGAASTKLKAESETGAEWAIRVQNLTTGEEHMVPVEPDAGNYYMTLSTGCSYVFQLGVLAGGSFQQACRSNRVTTPSDEAECGGSPEQVEEPWQSLRSAARPLDVHRAADAAGRPVGLTYESTRGHLALSASSESFVKK